ncbi:hypothetical protein BGX38DRAFT_1267204 [Terfezia claveryi]|nr:hypothetical protein BGX38DRAFT_1267204 [Terfezia claveryi]
MSSSLHLRRLDSYLGSPSQLANRARMVSQNKAILEREFAMVGFDAKGSLNTFAEGVQDKLLPEARFGKKGVPVDLTDLRENSPTVFAVYMTERDNIAFIWPGLSLMRSLSYGSLAQCDGLAGAASGVGEERGEY